MESKMLSHNWNLENLFEGGSKSYEFQTYLTNLEDTISEMELLINKLSVEGGKVNIELLKEIISYHALNDNRLIQSNSFISCLRSQDMNDKYTDILSGKVSDLNASYQNTLNLFDKKLSLIDDIEWNDILKSPEINTLNFILNERREGAKESLSSNEEKVISELSIDGYHSWGIMYEKVVSNFKIDFKGEELSAGQTYNLFDSGNRALREQIFEKWENEWLIHSEYLAAILNNISGFRLRVYKLRGWDNFLREPLKINRMQSETLDSMWKAVEKSKVPLIKYMERKAEILGIGKLSWFDLHAPLSEHTKIMPYQEGSDFILKKFEEFGHKLRNFATKAFENRWIEVEDRPGKSPGGFCTDFPEQNETRIFMTYSGTQTNISTLAHELGHAFHTDTMKDVHSLNKNYTMNVAETASTFAELLVIDAAIKGTDDSKEKISLIDNKLQNAVSLLMDIHSRFIFETSFYEERKNGLVSRERISELMLQSQKEAFGNSLDKYHPLFWASKMHFYLTDIPFYNFPYTFGYLFSLGIYAKYLYDRDNFEDTYINLLKDTGCMSVEQLALKHLGIDITKVDFWENAISVVVKDVELFLSLTSEL
jgi:pepF/M3 family oligoendopeptidase